MLWPDNRENEQEDQDGAAEEPIEGDMILPALVVSEDSADSAPTNRRMGSTTSTGSSEAGRRASESAEAYQRRTRTELNLMQRTEKAKQIRKRQAEEKVQLKEQKEKERREKALKLREKARKAGGKRKKKKKKKPAIHAAQCSIGDVVLSQKGIAVIRWKGMLQFRPNDTEWLGIEFLDEPRGKNDGSCKGVRYFQTKKNHGSFVKVVRKKLPPEEILKKLGTVKSQLRSQEEEMNDIKTKMAELLEAHEQQVGMIEEHKLSGSEGPHSPQKLSLFSYASKSLNLAKSISGSMDRFTEERPITKDLILNLGEIYDDSDSEYEFSADSSEDEEEEIEPMDRRKSNRKKLIDVAESRLYTEGSLRRIQDELLEQIDVLKKDQTSNAPKPSGKLPHIRRQKTFAGTRELGLDLPELHATSEEVEAWIQENLVKAPGCPDLENKEVLASLTWALRAFLNLNESHTY